MAERFGGRYSPGGEPPLKHGGQASSYQAPLTPTRKPGGGWRARALFLLSFVFLVPAFGGTPIAMTLDLAAGGCLILSSWLSYEGLRARAEWEARSIARRPGIPRLLLAAGATGIGLFLGGLANGLSLYPVLYAILGSLLHLGAFGLDPFTDKGAIGADSFQSTRAARTLGEAEKTLADMREAILTLRNRNLAARVERFADQVRLLMDRVERDPGDLAAARKYLSVYLQGARDATLKFVALWEQNHDEKAREDYQSLLDDLEATFARGTDALLRNDRTRLDIEVEVLRDRLKAEGPAPSTAERADHE